MAAGGAARYCGVVGKFKDTFSKVSTRMHRGIFMMSKGRVAGRAMGMDIVELTTMGRKSGKERHSMVGAPMCDDDRVVVVASYDGAPRNPAWYLNLAANPEVTVTRARREPQAMVARTANAEERAELWPAIVEKAKAYAKAQAKTDREFPVVILDPKR